MIHQINSDTADLYAIRAMLAVLKDRACQLAEYDLAAAIRDATHEIITPDLGKQLLRDAVDDSGRAKV